ncbi:MAG: Gfo/Idh/MocA family oxidoreductase [Kiritimatiellaeota bacterium]|nr:Gfo/Idh/MocA family oxidoreductase [Kiritimatiellota bacterium]
MKDGKLGFGIIGCGVIAPTHRKAIQACADAELIAVCDIDEAKGKAFAVQSGGVRFYRDFEKLAVDPEVDVVCVCTPSGLHADCVIAAAEAGKHAFCEKPLDIDRGRMTKMIEACRGAGVKLGCVFQSRTSPDNIKARQAIACGTLGRMVLGDAFLKSYRSQAYYDSAGWRGTWALDGGGALMNQGVHGVDLLLWLMNDDVERVFARCAHHVRDIEVEDTSVAVLEFKNGAYGTIIGTTSCNPGEKRRLELHGKLGTICITGSNIVRWAVTDEDDGRAQDVGPPKTVTDEGTTGDNRAVTAEGHVWLIDDMVRAIREERDPYITGESARKAVDLILAIYDSARMGQDVAVHE